MSQLKSSANKILLSIVVVAGFIFYSFSQRGGSAGNAVTAPSTVTPSVIGGSTQSTGSSTPPSPTPASAAVYKDGQFTGPSVDAFYGNVQVQATISGGKLTDVAFLTYPSDNHESKQISNSSLPQLKQEAIAAQSANVNVISGATQTSQGFSQSLAAALSMAKN